MPPEPIITETAPRPDLRKHFHVRTSLLLALVATGLLMVATPLLISKYRASTAPVAEVPVLHEEVVREPEVLGGKIYMSLAPVEDGGSPVLNIYSYDVATGLIEQETGDTSREYLTSDISPDGKSMAVGSFSKETTVANSDLGLFIHDFSTNDVMEVVTPGTVSTKRNPQWSQDNKSIVFSVLRDESNDFRIPENWDVYTYSIGDAVAQYRSKGVNPKFLPNGDIVILKNNGITAFSIADSTETLIIPVDGVASISIKFDVSNDGAKLAVSTASTNEMHVYQVSTWSPFEAKSKMVIPVSAFWPVFSPSGDFLAMQVFEWSGNTENRIPTDQRLGIFSLTDNTWLNFADLTPYHQDMLFITDWQPTR